jgi:hypothetical protein
MSYAPIYNKLRELDERVALMESTPKTTDEGITIVPIASNGLTTDELNKVKTDFENLLKESSALSTRIGKLTSLDLATLATKDELATLATKDELATLATKDELATLATKDELATLATKDELATLATKDELATLATKDELATLATKDELVTLATKDEVANLLVKFDNVINVISQLNAKINDAQEKLADL